MKREKILYKISQVIVNKRNLIFFIFILLSLFSLVSMNWTEVEEDLTAYLDEDTVTRQDLALMEDEFITLGSAEVMLSNIDYDTAYEVSLEIAEIEGVQSISFENTSDYYKESSAYFMITFETEETDEIALNAMEEIREVTAIYDTSVKTTVGVTDADTLAAEMNVIMVLAVVIILLVLLFTSKSYAEILVLLITFAAAAILNMGSNFIFGEISFVSDSVGVILQLALAIDYAVILCHRYAEERKLYEIEEACTVALSKALVEIASSSLTTMSGLLALSFMEYNLGADLSRVLIKSILLSLICVFTLMPGLLVVFGKLIDKTIHRSFVPSIRKIASMSLKSRFVVLPVFVVITIGASYFSYQTEYLFSESGAVAINMSERDQEEQRITDLFGTTNAIAIIVPSGDYEQESALLKTLDTYEEIDMVVGLANTEAMDGYMLTDALTARELSELFGFDYEDAVLLYSTYAIDEENYAKIINGIDTYEVPLIDIILFMDDMVKEEYITLEQELYDELIGQTDAIRDGQAQLETADYSRILITLNLLVESDETFAFIETLYEVCGKYYDEVHLLGESTSSMELASTFTTDNLMISILSALFVMIVLLFTFGSVAIPIFLITIIQAAIFINFAFPYFQNVGLFFIGYLVVSSIQMGANVDYAIVITNRYMSLRNQMDNKKAIIQALDESFVTVATSGIMLASAGIIIQYVSTDGTIATLGKCIGRGTIISMILVMVVLPQILYVGTKFIDKTAFSLKFSKKNQEVVNHEEL